ncbi:MAG: hypothetical protein R3Y22_02145 [Bacteroidales bacterium]
MSPKRKAGIAIFLLMVTALSIIVFPIIGANALSDFELNLFEYSKTFSGNSQIISDLTENIDMLSYKIYAYAVHLLYEHLGLDATLAVRIPSVLLIIAITSTLYLFNALYETLNHSFLASALFICCGAIMLMTFIASPVLIPAYILILTLITLYNQIKKKSIKHLISLTATITLLTLTVGCYAVAVVAIIAYLYLWTTSEKSRIAYLSITGAIVIATLIAFILIILINRDPFAVHEVIRLNSYSQYSNFYNFLIAVLFTTFPWSIPLTISLFWVIRNPQWAILEFKSLKPLQQYGITILLCTIPTMCYLNGLSIIMIIAAIFFNMIVMSNLFMLQLRHYALAFRLTGITTAIIGATIAISYIVLKITTVTILGYQIGLSDSDNSIVWVVINIGLIAAFIYTLFKNTRSIHQNNRYMYNIVILYLLSAILFIGSVYPSLFIE